MGDPAAGLDERYRYAQYKTWPEDERWELIGGQAWAMSPAPRSRHQDLVLELGTQLKSFLRQKPCKVYIAPFDVLLPASDEADDEVDTVVQPDISVFCDRAKLSDWGARGAPDLVMEILSPSTAKKDQNEKFELYQRAGVREYWVVEPEGRWLCVYRLGDEGRYGEGELREPVHGPYGRIESSVLEGFSVDPPALFAET